jgi:transposase
MKQQHRDIEQRNAQLQAELEALKLAYSNAVLERQVLVAERDVLTSERDALVVSQQELNHKVEVLKQENYTVRYQLNMLKKRVFGVKSERQVLDADASQLQMDFGTDTPTAEVEAEEKRMIEVSVKKGKTKPHQTGRVELPESLERIVEVVEPVGVNLDEMTKIGEEVTETLHYVPGELKVKRIIRPKYIAKKQTSESTTIHISPLPKGHLERIKATPELIAYLLVSKFADHLPIYRLMKMFDRHGVKIAYSTISNWVQVGANMLIPLLESLLEQVVQTDYLMVDETPNRVIDRTKKENIHRGQYWVYRDPVNHLCLYDYQPTRSKEALEPMLSNFTGYLQTDGFGVYKSLYEKSNRVKLVGCMAHIRRKFVEAETNDQLRATQALKYIQQLYELERTFAQVCVDAAEVKDKRQKESAPIINQFYTWLKQEYSATTPKSPIGNAIRYALDRFESMRRYLEDGRLRIDNNTVENSIRPLALGRKNYLYAGSHKTAQNAGLIYSLIESCRINQVNPYDYLVDMLKNLADSNHKTITQLLPNNYKKTSN